MDKDFRKVYKKLLDWEWFTDSHMVHLAIFLLLSASEHDSQRKGLTVGRGEIVCTMSGISESTGMSLQTLRTCMTRLKDCGFLTYKSTNKFTKITICNYAFYQGEKEVVQQILQQTNNKQTTNKKQTDSLSQTAPPDTADTSGSMTAAPTVNASPKAGKSPAENIDYLWVQNEWNSICTFLPKVARITDDRKTKIRIRVEEMGGWEKAMPVIDSIFRQVNSSNFLRGDNSRGWKCTFDWLFTNGKNWMKVYEGNYNSKPNSYATDSNGTPRYDPRRGIAPRSDEQKNWNSTF